jgi:hypothetical protein
VPSAPRRRDGPRGNSPPCAGGGPQLRSEMPGRPEAQREYSSRPPRAQPQPAAGLCRPNVHTTQRFAGPSHADRHNTRVGIVLDAALDGDRAEDHVDGRAGHCRRRGRRARPGRSPGRGRQGSRAVRRRRVCSPSSRPRSRAGPNAVGCDAERDHAAAALGSRPSSISAARRTSASERDMSARRCSPVRPTNSRLTADFELERSRSSTS